MTPPLREQADVDALRAGLLDGTIDAIATDHAPHAPETKAVPFAEAPPGMLGVQTALAVVLTTLVEPGIVSLQHALGALSWRPARIAGLDPASSNTASSPAGGHGGPVAPGAARRPRPGLADPPPPPGGGPRRPRPPRRGRDPRRDRPRPPVGRRLRPSREPRPQLALGRLEAHRSGAPHAAGGNPDGPRR